MGAPQVASVTYCETHDVFDIEFADGTRSTVPVADVREAFANALAGIDFEALLEQALARGAGETFH